LPQLLTTVSRLPRPAKAKQQADAEAEALLPDHPEQQEQEEQQQQQESPADAEQSFHGQLVQQQQELQARVLEALVPLLWQQLPEMGARALATCCSSLQRLGLWDHQLLQVRAAALGALSRQLPALLLCGARSEPAAGALAAKTSDAAAPPAFKLPTQAAADRAVALVDEMKPVELSMVASCLQVGPRLAGGPGPAAASS
jgi:hypothetical protein